MHRQRQQKIILPMQKIVSGTDKRQQRQLKSVTVKQPSAITTATATVVWTVKIQKVNQEAKSKTGHTIILYSALILSPSKSSKRHQPVATFLVDSDDDDNDNDDDSGRDSSSASSSDDNNNDKIVKLACEIIPTNLG